MSRNGNPGERRNGTKYKIHEPNANRVYIVIVQRLHTGSSKQMRFPDNVIFDDKLCRLQTNNLRKTRPLVESECKFHIGHIYREIEYEFDQVVLRISDGSSHNELTKQLFSETQSIIGAPGLLNSLVHECIRHNCSSQFLRDVIDQYDSNGEVSGMRLLVALNRLRRGIWEYNILERVECIEENYLLWSFRKCVFEMECMHEVKPSLYNRTTLVTKLLFKSNYYTRIDKNASNSMLIFDTLHDEFLDSGNTSNDRIGFSFDQVSSIALLECIKNLGIDIDEENYVYADFSTLKKRRLGD